MTLPPNLKVALAPSTTGDATSIVVTLDMRATGFHGGTSDPRTLEFAIAAPIHQMAYAAKEWLAAYEKWDLERTRGNS